MLTDLVVQLDWSVSTEVMCLVFLVYLQTGLTTYRGMASTVVDKVVC
jgi:hypothetical protein